MKSKSLKTILVVEDDTAILRKISEMLRDRGLQTLEARTQAEAVKLMVSKADQIAVALIDIVVPVKGRSADESNCQNRVGLTIARRIRETNPNIRLIGMSHYTDDEVRSWFHQYGSGFLPKAWLLGGAASDFIDVVENVARKKLHKRKPRSFIVHGHDDSALTDLIRFVEHSLRWSAPTILRDLPSHGLTIIEKFEEAVRKIDVVFVLLTPDDKAVALAAPNDVKRRARQNVIFELGYFFAKMQRLGGSVILLHRGGIELPSDIAGIGYVDISPGIEASGEAVRRELANWLK